MMMNLKNKIELTSKILFTCRKYQGMIETNAAIGGGKDSSLDDVQNSKQQQQENHF